MMGRACKGGRAPGPGGRLGLPVVPPRSDRLEPWEYDRELYRRRKRGGAAVPVARGFRRVHTRDDKLAVMYRGFIVLALVMEALRVV